MSSTGESVVCAQKPYSEDEIFRELILIFILFFLVAYFKASLMRFYYDMRNDTTFID